MSFFEVLGVIFIVMVVGFTVLFGMAIWVGFKLQTKVHDMYKEAYYELIGIVHSNMLAMDHNGKTGEDRDTQQTEQVWKRIETVENIVRNAEEAWNGSSD